MEEELYQNVKEYLHSNTLPVTFPSTKSNFIGLANRYALNANGELQRNGLPVVRENMQLQVYEQFHNHSGRIACWEKIRQR